MQADFDTVLQWLYLFNSLALARMALRQFALRRLARQLEQRMRAAQAADWMNTTPEFMLARLGKPQSQQPADDGSIGYHWRGERHALQALYRDNRCSSLLLTDVTPEPFPTVNTFFNCAVLAALVWSWKLTGFQLAPEMAMSELAQRFASAFIVMLAGSWLLSFVLRRQRLLLNLACIGTLLLALPLIR